MIATRKQQLIAETESAIVVCKRNGWELWFKAYYARLVSLLRIKPKELS